MKSKYISSGLENFNKVYFKWNLNTVCQYRCEYCYYHEHLNKTEPKGNVDSYMTVLKRLSLKSIPDFEIDLLGGEPTLHPEIRDIVETLCSNDKCGKVNIHTNLVKDETWYDKLDSPGLSKLELVGSYHPEYDTGNRKGSFTRKSIHLSNLMNVKYICNINIHEPYWTETEIVVNKLLSAGVKVGLQTLNHTEGTWETEYTDKFKQTLSRSLRDFQTNHGDNLIGAQNVKFVTDLNQVEWVDDYNVRINFLDNFNGWKCKPLFWNINPDGTFNNGCTGEKLAITNSNINTTVDCPVTTGCPCADCYKFYKHE